TGFDALRNPLLLELAAPVDLVVAILLRGGVVLFVVYHVRGAVELPVDLRLFLIGEVAAIGGALGFDFLVDFGLGPLGASGFTGGHLAALDAVGYALLLVVAALFDLVAILRKCGRRKQGSQGRAQDRLLHHVSFSSFFVSSKALGPLGL